MTRSAAWAGRDDAPLKPNANAAATQSHVYRLAIIACTVLKSMHGVGQALQRAVERGILLGETEAHDRGDRVLFIERGDRDRRDLVVRYDASAKRLVGFIEPERRKIDRQEIRPLRVQHGKPDIFQAAGQTITASRQIAAHCEKELIRLGEA